MTGTLFTIAEFLLTLRSLSLTAICMWKKCCNDFMCRFHLKTYYSDFLLKPTKKCTCWAPRPFQRKCLFTAMLPTMYLQIEGGDEEGQTQCEPTVQTKERMSFHGFQAWVWITFLVPVDFVCRSYSSIWPAFIFIEIPSKFTGSAYFCFIWQI